MADEPQVIRGIDWKAIFPFTLIFRSFRVAVHPSKLVLALLALIAIYVGGTVLDSIWPAAHRAVPAEPVLYQRIHDEAGLNDSFVAARDTQMKEMRGAYQQKLKDIHHPDGSLSDIKTSVIDQREATEKTARSSYDNLVKSGKNTPEEERSAARQRDATILAAYQNASAEWTFYSGIKGQGLFDAFSNYELGKLYFAFDQGRSLRFLGDDGVFGSLLDFLTVGPAWAFGYHPVFFTILTIYFLIIWAIFGGAISRIAAVQVARDEKISFRQSLTFSTSKFLSFVSAPIIPLLIVAAVGLFITVYALITMNIPALGPIVGGAFFVLPLVAAFVLTLVLIGLVCGFNLMYPTIAVEGSDSFDAISRSFSYVYARPWRMAFYTLIAAGYGAITYLFVRYFITLLLGAAYFFAGIGVFRHADNTLPLWNVLWPSPVATQRLSYGIDWMALGFGEKIGAALLAFWVYLLIAMLGAYAISFYFSASTIIYGLMRHEVDATELDDVYLEPTEDEFADSVSAGEAAPLPTPGAPVESPPGV